MTIEHSSQSDPESSRSSEGQQAQGLSVDSPGDCLALVRYTFGRLPHDSMVLIGLQSGTTGAHLRFDFSAALYRPKDAADRAAEWLAGPTAAPVPEAVVGVIFSDASSTEPDASAATLVLLVEQVMQQLGCPLVKMWHAQKGYIRDFNCTDSRCCPYPGPEVSEELKASLNRVPQLTRPPQAIAPAEAIQTFLSAPPPPNAPSVEMVSAARQLVRTSSSGQSALSLWEMSLSEIASGGTCPSALNPGYVATLLRSAEDPLFVQALAPLAAAGTDTANMGCRIYDLTEDVGPISEARQRALGNYAAALAGTFDGPPQWARIEALDALLYQLIPYPGSHRLNLLALKGWIEWTKGQGSAAALAVDQCLREEPQHLLADFFAQLFGKSGPCPWARIKQNSYSWWQNGA